MNGARSTVVSGIAPLPWRGQCAGRRSPAPRRWRMPESDDQRGGPADRAAIAGQRPHRTLVALLIGAILLMIVIATLTLH